MSLPNFDGQNFVAFFDVSGFKRKMKRDAQNAIRQLTRFYRETYHALAETREQQVQICGLLVSDCAVLVAKNRNLKRNIDALKSLLVTIQKLSRRLLPHDIMLSASIAYGEFHYQKRFEFPGIEKNLITGSAYIAAYLDQSSGKPKLQCGECRIVIENLPEDVRNAIQDGGRISPLNMVQLERHHFYFYWMRERPQQIPDFQAAYRNTENLKYFGIRLLLQGEQNLNVVGNNNP